MRATRKSLSWRGANDILQFIGVVLRAVEESQNAHRLCRMIYFINEDVGSNDCFSVAQFRESGIGT